MPKVLTLIVSIGLLSGCYEYRQTAQGVTPATNAHRTQWSLAWGLAKNGPLPADCQGAALQQVTVRDNLGFTLITVATLGLVNPKRVEWSCAPPQPSEGSLGAANGG